MIRSLRGRLDGAVTEPEEALALAGPLVVSLVVFVPAAGLAGRAAGLGLLAPLLAALTLVGVGYLAFTYVRGEILAGAYVAFLILSTFSANIPLGASEQFFLVTPGNLGPQLWLYQGPLFVLVGYLVVTRRFVLDSLSRAELLFGAFVGWTLVSALLGSGPRTDVALFFTWLMVQAWLVLWVVRHGVDRGIVSLESVITTFIVTLLGHVAFAGAQLLQDRPLGLTFLGEGITWHSGISYSLLGVHTHLIPSGLTGHGYVLVALVLLTAPATFLFAYRSDSIPGTAAVAAALLGAVALRLSTSDAGRGAFLVLAVCLVAGAAILARASEPPRFPSLRSRVRNLDASTLRSSLGLVIALVVVLSPSSRSGASSEDVAPIDPGQPGTPTETPATPTETPATPTQTPATPTETPPPKVPNVGDVSIPLFDLTHLGTRLQQIVVGLEIFSRNPILGVGGGNYRFVAATYGLPNAPNMPVPLVIHNVYLLLLVETGLPGFLLYFGAVGLVVASGVKSAVRGYKPHFNLAILASIAGYFAFLFFTHLVDQVNALLPFWAIAGAVVGEYRVGRDRTPPEPE